MFRVCETDHFSKSSPAPRPPNREGFQRLVGEVGLDEDNLYDPSHLNDRLLLGLNRTMSEAELHILRAGLQGGIRTKAHRGELKSARPSVLCTISKTAWCWTRIDRSNWAFVRFFKPTTGPDPSALWSNYSVSRTYCSHVVCAVDRTKGNWFGDRCAIPACCRACTTAVRRALKLDLVFTSPP